MTKGVQRRYTWEHETKLPQQDYQGVNMAQDESRQTATQRKRVVWPHIFFVLFALYLCAYLLYDALLIPHRAPILTGARKPLNIAHQGGELLAPSNTMAAFDLAASLNVDVLETDIHMTKDGQLVLMHDATVDRTTNGTGRVDSFTLAELKKLDAGYKFVDLQGNHSYRGKGVTVPTLEELFAKYGARFYYNVEMKDAYPKNGPSQIEAKLWALIQKYHLEQHVVVASFHQNLLDNFVKLSGDKTPLSAGEDEVTRFVIANKVMLPFFYRPQANVLQIPTDEKGINLIDPLLIERAHTLGLQVHYWTVDDPATMRRVIELGADGVITNRPDLLKEVLEQMHLR